MTTELRQRVVAAVALVVVAAAGFIGGLYSAPEKVREVEVVKWKERAEEKKAATKARVVDRIVYVDRVVSPEGEVRERRTITTKADTREATAVESVKESSGSSEKVREVTLRPDWRVGVLAGASLREPLVPIAGPLVLGASVERRIVGGLSAGAWVNTVGAAGASLSMEF